MSSRSSHQTNPSAANAAAAAAGIYTRRCGWNLSGGRSWDASGCRSYYMAEWTVFGFLIGAGVPAAQAAVGLTNLGAFSCPGSLAARALTCNTAYRECEQRPQRTVVLQAANAANAVDTPYAAGLPRPCTVLYQG